MVLTGQQVEGMLEKLKRGECVILTYPGLEISNLVYYFSKTLGISLDYRGTGIIDNCEIYPKN